VSGTVQPDARAYWTQSLEEAWTFMEQVRAVPLAEIGGPYLEISERTPFESPFISAGARANRRRIAELFAEQGFVAYPFEFWHFSQGDVYEALLRRTGRPAPFGPVHATGPGVPVAPVLDPQAPLLNLAQVRALVAAARQRLGAGVP
jgi:hypothetical protein